MSGVSVQGRLCASRVPWNKMIPSGGCVRIYSIMREQPKQQRRRCRANQSEKEFDRPHNAVSCNCSIFNGWRDQQWVRVSSTQAQLAPPTVHRSVVLQTLACTGHEGRLNFLANS